MRTLLPTLALAALSACDEPRAPSLRPIPAPPPVRNSAEPETQRGMRLVLTADKVVVRQGERFGIGATLQNVSGRAIRHNFRTFEHICEVVEEYFEALKEVDDPSPAAHRRANPAGWIRRPARSFTAEDALDPFPSIRFISSRYSSEIGAGMSVRDAYGATASRPGVYRIRLEWSSDYSDDPAENFWKGTLRSNDVVIDVRPNRELDDR